MYSARKERSKPWGHSYLWVGHLERRSTPVICLIGNRIGSLILP